MYLQKYSSVRDKLYNANIRIAHFTTFFLEIGLKDVNERFYKNVVPNEQNINTQYTQIVDNRAAVSERLICTR